MRKFYQLYIARSEADDSTATVGELLGITKAAYWNKENGNAPFKLAEAFLLAKRYNTTIEELFPETLSISKKGVS